MANGSQMTRVRRGFVKSACLGSPLVLLSSQTRLMAYKGTLSACRHLNSDINITDHDIQKAADLSVCARARASVCTRPRSTQAQTGHLAIRTSFEWVLNQ